MDEKRAQGRVGRSDTVHWQPHHFKKKKLEPPYVVSYKKLNLPCRRRQNFIEFFRAAVTLRVPMPRKLSSIAPDWWDYTTLDDDIIRDAAALTPDKMVKLSRPGFKVVMYETLEDFYLAEALEYITAWKRSTPDNPVGICGPIGPTEQLPLVVRLVNDLGLSLRSAHFWGMDEWYLKGKEAPPTHPLSFEKADRDLCFSRIRKDLVMPGSNLHFPKGNTTAYRNSWTAGV